MVLQRFQLELADPNYTLELKATLTIKPKNFKMKVRRRPGRSDWHGIPGGVQKHAEQQKMSSAVSQSVHTGPEKPMRLFFGGNTGKGENLALYTMADLFQGLAKLSLSHSKHPLKHTDSMLP